MEPRIRAGAIIDGIPHFGAKQSGINYIQRPSVYALALNSNQQIAIVKHKSAFFLPGGGIEDGETPIAALQREIIEETRFQAVDFEKCFEAIEYLQGVPSWKYYCIHSTFFAARLSANTSGSIEPDHQLIWMNPEKAIPKMQRACHQWAIKEFLNGRFGK